MHWLYALECVHCDFEPALNTLNVVYLFNKSFGEFKSKASDQPIEILKHYTLNVRSK